MSYEVSVAAQPRRPIAAVAATTTWDRYPGQWRGMLDEAWACLRQIALDALEVVPGQGQIGLLPFEDQVEERALLVAGVLEQADQTVLLAQSDEDVLDGVVEPERFHRPHLRPDDLGVARRAGDVSCADQNR